MTTHQETHFTGSAMVRDVVIGMSDGLTVPFALAAGLSGAVDTNDIIITAGLAEIVAGSIAMGLGGFLAAKTENEHYDAELNREHYEIIHFPDRERQEIHEIFESYGLSNESCEKIVDELEKDKDKYAEFMMKFELGMDKPDTKRAKKSAFNIGIAYIIGGVIPLTSYWFTTSPRDGLLWSALMTVICLFVFGFVKNRIIKQNPWKGAIRVTVIGVLAAATAYVAAKLIGG